MHVVFSCENTTYMWWQAELLHYTFLLEGGRSELTAIVSATAEPNHTFSCRTFKATNYKASVGDLEVESLNKPGGIAEWAASGGPSDEAVLIVDPDSVFVRSVAEPGELPAQMAYSEQHPYMALNLPQNRVVLQRHCPEELRNKIQPVGIYIMMNRECLALLAKRWLERSIDIASDKVCRQALGGTGWLSEMWGYAIAAAEQGIHHQIKAFSQVTGSNSLANPITHYCFPVLREEFGMWDPASQNPILWSKWSYKPWEEPPDSSGTTIESAHLLERLRALAKYKRSDLIPARHIGASCNA